MRAQAPSPSGRGLVLRQSYIEVWYSRPRLCRDSSHSGERLCQMRRFSGRHRIAADSRRADRAEARHPDSPNWGTHGGQRHVREYQSFSDEFPKRRVYGTTCRSSAALGCLRRRRRCALMSLSAEHILTPRTSLLNWRMIMGPGRNLPVCPFSRSRLTHIRGVCTGLWLNTVRVSPFDDAAILVRNGGLGEAPVRYRGMDSPAHHSHRKGRLFRAPRLPGGVLWSCVVGRARCEAVSRRRTPVGRAWDQALSFAVR